MSVDTDPPFRVCRPGHLVFGRVLKKPGRQKPFFMTYVQRYPETILDLEDVEEIHDEWLWLIAMTVAYNTRLVGVSKKVRGRFENKTASTPQEVRRIDAPRPEPAGSDGSLVDPAEPVWDGQSTKAKRRRRDERFKASDRSYARGLADGITRGRNEGKSWSAGQSTAMGRLRAKVEGLKASVTDHQRTITRLRELLDERDARLIAVEGHDRPFRDVAASMQRRIDALEEENVRLLEGGRPGPRVVRHEVRSAAKCTVLLKRLRR